MMLAILYDIPDLTEALLVGRTREAVEGFFGLDLLEPGVAPRSPGPPSSARPALPSPPAIADTTIRIEDQSTAATALLVKPLVGRVWLEPTTGGL
jgi:hypothetical protein